MGIEWASKKFDVFCRHLKTENNVDAMTPGVKPFQTRAAATSKTQWKMVTLYVGGMSSSDIDKERTCRRESMPTTRGSSDSTYGGAVPCRQRKANKGSLNSIRRGTRNQWRSGSSDVMWPNFRDEHIIAVITDCSLPRRSRSHCRTQREQWTRIRSATVRRAETLIGLLRICRGTAEQLDTALETWVLSDSVESM